MFLADIAGIMILIQLSKNDCLSRVYVLQIMALINHLIICACV